MSSSCVPVPLSPVPPNTVRPSIGVAVIAIDVDDFKPPAPEFAPSSLLPVVVFGE